MYPKRLAEQLEIHNMLKMPPITLEESLRDLAAPKADILKFVISLWKIDVVQGFVQ